MTDEGGDNVVWLRHDRSSLGRIHGRLSRIEDQLDLLASDGGGGGIDAWQHSVESRLAQLHGDIMDVRGEVRALRGEMGGWFRWLIGLLVVSFAAVLGVMARGFDWL